MPPLSHVRVDSECQTEHFESFYFLQKSRKVNGVDDRKVLASANQIAATQPNAGQLNCTRGRECQSTLLSCVLSNKQFDWFLMTKDI